MTQQDKTNRASWKQNPEAVQANILAVATEEFAEHGLAGARMDEIAARTRTSKRMIYYYFTDKETLYQRVLENAYRKVRMEEAALELASLSPPDALRRLVEFTFDHHCANEVFIRLVMIENIHKAKHLSGSELIAHVNASAIDSLAQICDRGRAKGSLRADISPLELHWQISALCFFNVSNRFTFGKNFGPELFEASGQQRLRTIIADTILTFMTATATD
ncbi:MAG: TetR family transcriptional regulator [Roseinatronobacter sp.]|jgi:AcrR family transcriptional regulator|nr:TetR family transcriptional regulator [Roseinatronobacter sp.]